MSTPTYLAKNRHGAFIFRIKVPVQLLHLFAGKKAITKSLKTYHRPTALKLARRYATVADDLFCQLEMKSKYEFDKIKLKAHRSIARAKLHDLKDNLSLDALKLLQQQGSNSSPELDDFIARATPLDEKIRRIETTIETLDRKIKIADEIETRNAVLNDYGLAIPQTQQQEDSPALSSLWPEYRAAKIRAKKWKPSDESKMKERDNQFRDFLEIIGGDRPATQFKRSDADKFIDNLLKYPVNRWVKWANIPNLSEIPEDSQKISQSTASQRIEFISGFFKYLIQEEIIASNPFDGKLIDRDSKNNPTPTTQDLKEWFNLPEHLIEKAWQFWIPRIALFSGARQNEIAQLRPKDIKKDEETGIWCISINSTDGKSTKSKNSERLIPLHKELIDNGILDYVKLTKQKGLTSLWPDLKGKAGDLGAEVSAYWTKLRDVHKVLSEPTGENGKEKTFHSIRRVIINRLTKAGVELILIQSIVGHELSTGNTSPYLDEVPIEIKDPAMQKLTIEGVSWEHPKKFVITK